MAEHTGAQGEVGPNVSPWALRGAVPALGRTPALRGFPGGIDMAGPGWLGGLAEEDQAAHEPWPRAADEPVTLASSGAGADLLNGTGSPPPGLAQPPGRGNAASIGDLGRNGRLARNSDPAASRRQRPGQVPPGGRAGTGDGRSVWQRAVSAWHAAGLEWQHAPGWALEDADVARTEPIPVVPAADVPAPENGTAPQGAARAPAGSTRVESGPADGDDRADGDEPAGGDGRADDGPAVGDGPATAAVPGAVAVDAGTEAAASDAVPAAPAAGAAATEAAPAAAAGAAGTAGDEPQPKATGSGDAVRGAEPALGAPSGHSRAGRKALVGAIICVAVIALAITAIVVTGAGGGGGQPAGLALASQSAVLADAQFAGPGGLAQSAVPPALTGVAAVGSTVVAIGGQATQPAAQPLMLTSADGGQNWQRAVLHVPGGAITGEGAVPLMVAGAPGRWLALAANATWTSTDGRTWRLGPAIAPVAAGDRVLALAPAATGFLAVGENVRLQGTGVARTPVLWRTSDGFTWEREGAAQLRLPSGKGQVVALRWLAARGSAVMIAGDIARSVTKRRGKHLVSVTTESVMVWLTTNGGLTWVTADPPVNNGATRGLAGLAATGSGLVAIRPGHTAGGVPDAVAYLATHGAAWRYGGKLRALRGGGFTVTTVSGSDGGAVVAGSAGRYRVAFVSLRGWSWRQTAHLATSRAAAVTGVTVGPYGNVIATGAGPRPFLLLARRRRMPVGQASLAAAAAGGVSVNSVAASQGSQVAVGEAGGKPAVWLQSAGGQWPQVTTPALPSWRAGGPGLSSVVHGSAGWLAIGTEGGPGSAAPVGSTGLLTTGAIGGHAQPVMLTSADGHTWQAQSGPGPAAPPTQTLTGAAAGPAGYVVVGLQSNGGRPVPALFWSADLRTWSPGSWTGYAPASQPVSVPLAVAAGPAGFAAVGGAGDRPAVWLSRTGQDWIMRPLALPRGARGAVLQRVAIHGGRIVVVGTEARGSGPAPFVAVSADGGQTWREYLLPAPAHPATVTALAAAGRGFAATGTVALPSGSQNVITWWSADGRNWQLARPAGIALSGPGEHAITGLAALHNQVTGVGYAVTRTGSHPVLWRARIG